MIDVQKCALCTFKENFFPALEGTMKINHCVLDKWPQLFSSRKITFIDLAKNDRPCAERLKDSVVLDHLGLQFFRENNRLHQVGHAQAGARGFVSVGGTNSTFRSPDFGSALAQLALLIQQTVVRQNQMGTIANEQILPDSDSQFAQAFDLPDERDGIDNNAIANHAGFSAPEYSRRN